MHPRQANLFEQAVELADRTAGKKKLSEKTQQGAAKPTGPVTPGILWKYTDPEGKVFYLEQKVVGPMRSPFTGKTFTPKLNESLEKVTQVKKEMKEEQTKKAAWHV